MKYVCGKMMHWGRVDRGFTVFRLYHTVNIICLGYKNQLVNSVEGNNCCFFSDPYKTHQFNMWDVNRIF